jgi:hypothetical protein
MSDYDFSFVEDWYQPSYNFSFGESPPTSSGICYQIWVDSNTQWVDWSDAQWGECYAGILNQIWTDSNYVFAAIDFGLDIIDIVTEMKIAYIEWDSGFNSVWANDERVYLATSNSGIMYFDKVCISGSIMSPYDLVGCLTDYVTPYGITSNNIRYIHGNENRLICCTNSGVDVLAPSYRSYTTLSGAQKCFLTADNAYYTTINSVKRVKGLFDWTSADRDYDSITAGLTINDIYVTDTTLFAATSSGVFVIEESTYDYVVFYTGS